MFAFILLALTPLPPELGPPHRGDWVNDLLFRGNREVVVLFGTDRAGVVTRVAVRTKRRTIEIPVKFWPDLLMEALKKVRSEAECPDSVRIATDAQTQRRHLRDVVEVCKQAGFREIAYRPPAADGPR
jgi:hypothetical protein